LHDFFIFFEWSIKHDYFHASWTIGYETRNLPHFDNNGAMLRLGLVVIFLASVGLWGSAQYVDAATPPTDPPTPEGRVTASGMLIFSHWFCHKLSLGNFVAASYRHASQLRQGSCLLLSIVVA
jgi:hypothetical protein